MFDPALIDRQEALRVAYRMTRDRDRAEDLVQDALARAWANREQFREVGLTARAWFYRLMRNLYISQHRRRATETAHASDLPGWARETATTLDDHVDHDRLLIQINKLPEWARSVLTARSIGSSYQEIASDYHIPIGTVMSRLFRARALLHTA